MQIRQMGHKVSHQKTHAFREVHSVYADAEPAYVYTRIVFFPTFPVPKAYKAPEFLEELQALLTEQGTVSLECKVVGVPTPVLRWYKDGQEIKAGDVFALTANPDDPTSLGTYTCEAVNCMGKACSSSRVHVVGKGSREGSLKPADRSVACLC